MADRVNERYSLERARITKDKTVCDANNNAYDNRTQVASAEQKQVGQDICEHGAHNRIERGESQSSSSLRQSGEIDDWHLLDVDERLSTDADECEMLAAPRANDNCAQNCDTHTGSCDVQVSKTNSRRSEISDIIAPDSKNKNKNKSNMSKQASGTKFIVIDHQEDRKKLNWALVHLCTAIYSLVPLASLLTFALLIYLLLFTKLWFITIIYYTYLLIDAKTCNRGGRRWEWVHKARFWSYLAAYFPIRIRHSRQFKLNPSENYILNYHPHGISAFGCVCSFATDALGFSKLFPGIKSRFMVHETSFLVPIMRETFGLRGDCSVNSASFDYILSQKWKQEQQKQHQHQQAQQPEIADGGSGGQGGGGGGGCGESARARAASGNLLALCGGGLAEADLSDMQTLKIVCATRKGFVKKALIHGAHLVPCIAFGENSVFKKVNLTPGSLSHRLETKWYQLFKFKHPIYYGASFFNSKFWHGIMPFKRPITVCMADPIEVERIAEPSQKQIDHFHSLYMDRLRMLYEEHKDLCDKYDLEIELL